LVQSFATSPNFLVTSPTAEYGYGQIEFNLANNFWGISMNLGNGANGMHLRQGMAHLINKNTFVTRDISGGCCILADAIDNPVPNSTSLGFTRPNSCLWDESFTETGAVCTRAGGPPGGVAYDCAASGITSSCAGGVVISGSNYPWQPLIGSADFCAAAGHFITAFGNAGIGTLQENSSCVLQPPTGQGIFPSPITSNTVNFFIRTDDPALYDLGISMAQEICALWTGALTTGCNFPGTIIPALTVSTGNTTSFCGYTTDKSVVNTCWWIYVDAFSNVFPIDQSLYFTYNSRFVSGVSAAHTGGCDSSSVPTFSAPNFIYLCNPSYDTASSNVEFAADGPTALSAATVAADTFGRAAFSIPVFSRIDQFAYLNGWQGVINGEGSGIPNFFTWLNAYDPTPSTGTNGCPTSSPLCMRQGFSQTTRSLSPYVARTPWDMRFLRNIYDSPLVENPAHNIELLDWMTTSHTFAPLSMQLNLRHDIFFQDGRQLTGYDVQFSYATLAASGSFLGRALAGTSVTVNPNDKSQVTISFTKSGPFTPYSIGTTPVFPGRYWSTCSGATWDDDLRQLGMVPNACMTLAPAKAGVSFDPLANQVLVGSGPWECADVLGGSGVVGFGCSDIGTQNPVAGHSYTLTRYGKGQVPGGSAVGQYFRSFGALALYLWTGAIGDTAQDIITSNAIQGCNGPSQGTPTLGHTSGCGHWQQGIGQPGGLGLITQTQVNIFQRFAHLNWVAPQTWAAPPCSAPGVCTGATTPPDLMAQFAGSITPFFEGPNVLHSAAEKGCTSAYSPTSSTSGGFDC